MDLMKCKDILADREWKRIDNLAMDWMKCKDILADREWKRIDNLAIDLMKCKDILAVDLMKWQRYPSQQRMKAHW